jgi:hypothetical protein
VLEKAKRRIAELERKIGQQELEIDFFERALQRIEQRQSLAAAPSLGRSEPGQLLPALGGIGVRVRATPHFFHLANR